MRKVTRLALMSAVSVGMFMSSSSAVAAPAFSAAQKKALGPIIELYLMKNPEIIGKAALALRDKQMKEQQLAANQAISENKKALFDSPVLPKMGSDKPAVYLTEFFDYQCGHCKQMRKTVAKILKNNPQARVTFVDFPIFGKGSQYAARVALAANLQGKYWTVHEGLLEAKNPITEDKALKVAKDAGLNMKQLKKDIDSSKVSDILKSNEQLARKLNLSGTPALVFANATQTHFQFVGGAMPYGPLSQLLKEVENPSDSK